jgi:SAM-dependent methyltransferase
MSNFYDDPEFFASYQEARLSGVSENDLVEQPALRACLPPLDGLHVLDLGCGGGQLAGYCIQQGAKSVTGVDLSINMITYAKEHHADPRIHYLNFAIENVGLDRDSYDLIVSSLAMHYIETYEQIVERVVHALSPGGYFIFSTLHPNITARNARKGWIRDPEGKKLYWPLDNYLEDGAREMELTPGRTATFHHRSMSTTVNTLLRAGLELSELIEPTCTPDGLALQPGQAVETRRPTFIVLKARKPLEHPSPGR